MSVSVWASVGDHGVLNTPLSSALSDVWIDRDLSWLDFNARVLAEAFDERAPFVPAAARDQAYEELLIAEGSYWFWWYGDDHSSDQDKDFDELVRRHLRNAYEALGLEPPAELHVTNISTAAAPQAGGVMERST